MKKTIILTLAFIISTPAFALEVKNEKVILEKLEDYNECQARSYEGNICDTALRAWVEKHPKDAFKAGKMTRLKMNAWGAIYFFDLAFKKKAGDCKDQDVWLAVESAANLPESHIAPLEGMRKIAFTHCFAEFKDNLIKTAALGSYEKANLCPGLKEKKAATPACQ